MDGIGSNAHGPDEHLDITMFKKFVGCMAYILTKNNKNWFIWLNINYISSHVNISIAFDYYLFITHFILINLCLRTLCFTLFLGGIKKIMVVFYCTIIFQNSQIIWK